MTDPGVAVVVTVIHEMARLPETLASVAAQTRPASDVIVVDGRWGGDAEKVSLPSDVRYVRPSKPGLPSARNAGLAAARDRYVQFLEAGDVLMPIAIAAGLACIEEASLPALVVGAHRRTDIDGRPIGPRQHTDLDVDAYAALLRGRLVESHAAVLYRRASLEAAGGFREDLRAFSDYDLHLRLARRHSVASHPFETARQCFRPVTTNRARSQLADVLRVHRAHRPTPSDPPEWLRSWQVGAGRLRDDYARQSWDSARSAARLGPRAALAAAMLSPRLVGREIAFRAGRATVGALPAPLGELVARRRPDLRTPGVRRVRLGDLNRTRPVSRDFGFDRGLPVDRYYIERFLENRRRDIRGRVLEVGDATYSRRFGSGQIERQDVVHVHHGNPAATIVGDISRAGTLPPSTFDCIVLTQTLHLIYDIAATVRELHAALKPGGVLLLTVPGISQIDRGEWGEQWFWALTPAAVRRLLGEVFGESAVTVEGHGNVFAATAFLHGLALAEVDMAKLDVRDDAYPVVVTALATKWEPTRSDHVSE